MLFDSEFMKTGKSMYLKCIKNKVKYRKIATASINCYVAANLSLYTMKFLNPTHEIINGSWVTML